MHRDKTVLEEEVATLRAALQSKDAVSSELQRRMVIAGQKVDPEKRVLVEWMCAEDSNLSRMSEERGVKSVRVTEKSCDVDSQVGFNMARNVVMFFITAGRIVDLMGSLPCKHWCNWHYVNAHVWGQEYHAWLLEQRKWSKVQVLRFIAVAKIVLNAGGRVLFEWPRYCGGHALACLQAWIRECSLFLVDVDGCQVEVRNSRGEPLYN